MDGDHELLGMKACILTIQESFFQFLLLALLLGITSGGLREPYENAGIETRSAVYKANTLTSGLLRWPNNRFLYLISSFGPPLTCAQNLLLSL